MALKEAEKNTGSSLAATEFLAAVSQSVRQGDSQSVSQSVRQTRRRLGALHRSYSPPTPPTSAVIQELSISISAHSPLSRQGGCSDVKEDEGVSGAELHPEENQVSHGESIFICRNTIVIHFLHIFHRFLFF